MFLLYLQMPHVTEGEHMILDHIFILVEFVPTGEQISGLSARDTVVEMFKNLFVY